MRSLFVIILLLCGSMFVKAQGKKDLYTRIDTVLNRFENLELEQYIDSSASRFLTEHDHAFVFKQILPSNQANYAGMLRMIYPEGILIDLYVRSFEYANPNGINQRKNIRRFGRETIAAIRVHNDLACLNGCD